MVVIIPEIAAVEEEPSAANGGLVGEASEDLDLGLGEAEVAVTSVEILHALSECVNGGVARTLDDGGVPLAGDLTGGVF